MTKPMYTGKSLGRDVIIDAIERGDKPCPDHINLGKQLPKEEFYKHLANLKSFVKALHDGLDFRYSNFSNGQEAMRLRKYVNTLDSSMRALESEVDRICTAVRDGGKDV